jgi:hypothetical protein
LPSGAGEGGVGIPVGATSQIQGKETVWINNTAI